MSTTPESHPASRPIGVRFFAMLREQAGCSTLTVVSSATDPHALYGELQARLGLTCDASLLRVAINGRYARFADALAEGDEVVFIPPVAGG